jgi:hypothetical protein
LLGVGASRFREVIGARMGRSWSFTFDQYFAGLPVIDGRIDVRINMRGIVAMLGSRSVPIPADFDVAPRLPVEAAQATAWSRLEGPLSGVPQPAPIAPSRMVIWSDTAASASAPFFLCWEVAVSNLDASGDGQVGRFYVDAKDGFVHHYRNDKHQCLSPSCHPAAEGAGASRAAEAGTGPAIGNPAIGPTALPIPTIVTLRAWTRTGADAFSALVDTPLAGIELSVPGVGVRTTNANGQITIDIAAPVGISIGALDGRHFAPISGPNGPTGFVVVNPGVATTLQLSSAAASSAEAAHATLAYWVESTNEFGRSIFGNSSQLVTLSSITPTVNIANVCNAFYTANTINFYQAGGGCPNTAFSTVVTHEWGHGLDDRYGGIANTPAEGLSEGWADALAMYLVDSPLVGSGFFSPGIALRRGDNTFLYPYAASAPQDAGQVWMGFAWQVRERLRTAFGTPTAIAISNDIVLGSIVANATTRVDATREVFLADDDDGNLLNGTPNYEQLSAAAIGKALPYPERLVGTITHAPLANTSLRYTPRLVTATVTPAFGSFPQVRLVYDTGLGPQTRNMKPDGATNGFQAVLPGIVDGIVRYRIEAVHSTGQIIRFPASSEFSYAVLGGALQAFFTENFDTTAPGWTSALVSGSNDWQRGDPTGRSGVSGGIAWADPADAVSLPNAFGNDLGLTGLANGAYPPNSESVLRSPVVNCTGRVGVRLRFRRWLTVEQRLYDQATLSVNGQPIWQNPQSTNLIDVSWQQVEYSIPVADNNPAVQIEWRLRTDGSVNLGGWTIDDVQLLTVASTTVDADLRLLPEQVVQGATMFLQIATPGGSRPWLLGIGDTPGPTLVPGFPLLFVGGASLIVLPGNTDATGNAFTSFTAPNVPSAVGVLLYSQLLTLNSTLTQFVTSNPCLNLITQTP